MLITRYVDYVAETSRFEKFTLEQQRRISIYGLVSEVGSVVSAVKKEKLNQADCRLARHELREELGDVMWYCFALAKIEGVGRDDIMARQLKSLDKRLKGESKESISFRKHFEQSQITEFHQNAEMFLRKKRGTFREFQEISYLTARTKGKDLVETGLIELMNLSAQLMRPLLPKSEQNMHSQIATRDALDVLGAIAWYLAAIATAYDLSLNEIADTNVQKAQLHQFVPQPVPQHAHKHTPLHDRNCPEKQQLPRRFEVRFLTVGKGRSRMYLDGHQLGDELTDNFYEDDGYRFHDALHLANIAYLGWSPVLRGLMKRKRKANPKVDEVQDGARAQIVEEAVVKAIHSEVKERSDIVHHDLESEEKPTLSDEVDIPFSFFKLIQRYVKGLEVANNSFYEWEQSIREGYRIYDKLRAHGQGTVTVDLNQRKITFHPDVYVDIAGAVVSIGSCAVPLDRFEKDVQDETQTWLTEPELDRWRRDGSESVRLACHFAAKRAILQALGIDNPTPEFFTALILSETDPGKFSVRTESPLQEIMWQQGVVVFKTSFALSQNSVCCTALALSDVSENKG